MEVQDQPNYHLQEMCSVSGPRQDWEWMLSQPLLGSQYSTSHAHTGLGQLQSEVYNIVSKRVALLVFPIL